MTINCSVTSKGNVLPRAGHESPEGEYLYTTTLSLTSAVDGMRGQHHASAAFPLEKTRYPLYRRKGGPQGRSGINILIQNINKKLFWREMNNWRHLKSTFWTFSLPCQNA